jgi:uncharacterized protein YdaU (DUF1376 family)
MKERKKPLPYLRWYVTDYRASRNANRLTWQERGLYRELLDECWVEGSIPDDIVRLAEIARCPVGVMAEAWPEMRGLFVEIDGLDGMYLTSRRLEIERSEEDRRRVAMSNGGKRGAQTRRKHLEGGSRSSSSSEQLEQSKSSSAASASSAQPLEGAASDADRLATPEEIRAILDNLKPRANP